MFQVQYKKPSTLHKAIVIKTKQEENNSKQFKTNAKKNLIINNLNDMPKYISGLNKQYMLVSFPRQGTDFFMSCLQESNPKVDYYREFFNPICNIGHYKQLVSEGFGSENNPNKIFYYDEKILEDIYKRSWVFRNRYNTDKEVFGFIKLPFYKKHFELFGLYRHRKYTFPSSKSNFIQPIFDAFLFYSYPQNPILNQIKNYLLPKRVLYNLVDKQVLSHILCWYIQFMFFQENNIKVMDYDIIMNLEEQELDEYLKEKLPAELYTPVLTKTLYNKRKPDISQNRTFKYYELNVEDKCTDFINFLKKLNYPLSKEYWSLLE
jgi:hypothetical protein